jgi:hypothetical protein
VTGAGCATGGSAPLARPRVRGSRPTFGKRRQLFAGKEEMQERGALSLRKVTADFDSMAPGHVSN